MAAAMVRFGSAFPTSRLVLEEVPHSLAAALRFVIGAVLMGAGAAAPGTCSPGRWVDRPRGGERRVVARAAAAGLLGVFAYNGLFFFWASSLAPAADGSVLVPALSPVLTTAFPLFLASSGRGRSGEGSPGTVLP